MMTLQALMSAAGMNGYIIQEQTRNRMLMVSTYSQNTLEIHHDEGFNAVAIGPDATFIDEEARIQFGHLMGVGEVRA